MNLLKKLKTIDNRGISHLIAPLIICLVAVGGTFALVASHAATPTRKIAVSASTRKAKSKLHVVSFTLSSTKIHLESEIQIKSRAMSQAECSGFVNLTLDKTGATAPILVSALPATWNGSACKANLDISDNFAPGKYSVKLKYDGGNVLGAYTHSAFKRTVKAQRVAQPSSAQSQAPACVGALC